MVDGRRGPDGARAVVARVRLLLTKLGLRAASLPSRPQAGPPFMPGSKLLHPEAWLRFWLHTSSRAGLGGGGGKRRIGERRAHDRVRGRHTARGLDAGSVYCHRTSAGFLNGLVAASLSSPYVPAGDTAGWGGWGRHGDCTETDIGAVVTPSTGRTTWRLHTHCNDRHWDCSVLVYFSGAVVRIFNSPQPRNDAKAGGGVFHLVSRYDTTLCHLGLQ